MFRLQTLRKYKSPSELVKNINIVEESSGYTETSCKCLEAWNNASQRKPVSGKKNVVFPAVLQALCRLTAVLGESCLQGKLDSMTVSETLLCLTASAELPMQSCQPGIKHTGFLEEQPGQWFEGGVKPFMADREEKQFQGLWELSESLFLVLQGLGQSPRQRLSHSLQAEAVCKGSGCSGIPP